jgi:hypothetical protein
VHDRIADELSGPVVGQLAAALGLDDLDVAAQRQLAGFRAAPRRIDRRVLEQEQEIR